MLDQTMSLIWFRLRLLWRRERRRPPPDLPETEHLRRDVNLPTTEPGRRWWELLP